LGVHKFQDFEKNVLKGFGKVVFSNGEFSKLTTRAILGRTRFVGTTLDITEQEQSTAVSAMVSPRISPRVFPFAPGALLLAARRSKSTPTFASAKNLSLDDHCGEIRNLLDRA
jgi:hypothetical protein